MAAERSKRAASRASQSITWWSQGGFWVWAKRTFSPAHGSLAAESGRSASPLHWPSRPRYRTSTRPRQRGSVSPQSQVSEVHARYHGGLGAPLWLPWRGLAPGTWAALSVGTRPVPRSCREAPPTNPRSPLAGRSGRAFHTLCAGSHQGPQGVWFGLGPWSSRPYRRFRLCCPGSMCSFQPIHLHIHLPRPLSDFFPPNLPSDNVVSNRKIPPCVVDQLTVSSGLNPIHSFLTLLW